MADAIHEVKGGLMRILGLLLAVVLLAGAAWTAGWFYAAGAAGRGLDGWIAAEAAQGRRWTCPNRDVGGFPAALEITCEHPAFAGLALGEQAAGSLARARIRVGLLDPRHATVILGAPLAYRTDDGATDFTATWDRLTLKADGLPDAVAGGTLGGTGVAAQGRFGAAQAATPRAGRLDLAVASVAAADPTVDFSLAVDEVAVPVFDRALGDERPVAVVLKGRLTQAVFEDGETPAALMERWRQRGGSISFSSAQLARGPSRVEASGSVHLDGAHRVEGKLDAGFSGAGPILRRYGINPNLVAAGSILNSLFGRRDAAASKPVGDPDAIRLPIQLRNGRVGIGPMVTAIELPPLY